MHKNHINDFQMALNIPIDCHNGETFIKVNQMQYPQSVPNIKNDICWFSLDIEFNDFLLNSSKQATSSMLLLSISKQFISHGIYEIEDLCDIMNETLDQFDINVKLGKNHIIFIDYSFYYEYWCNKKKYNRESTRWRQLEHLLFNHHFMEQKEEKHWDENYSKFVQKTFVHAWVL